MKKTFAIAVALIAVALVAALVFRFRAPEGASPGPGPAEKPKSTPAAPSAAPRSPETPAPKPAPPETADDTAAPAAGPRFYTFPRRENAPNYPIVPQEVDGRFTRTDDGFLQVNPALGHAGALHDPNTSVEQDLEQLDSILSFYRWIFRQNPVGDNEDIIAQLTGKNSMNVVVIQPDHPAIDAEGRLLDRYGNPYFFHALSGGKMDIWSFGPDGIIDTVDDIMLNGPDPAEEAGGSGDESQD